MAGFQYNLEKVLNQRNEVEQSFRVCVAKVAEEYASNREAREKDQLRYEQKRLQRDEDGITKTDRLKQSYSHAEYLREALKQSAILEEKAKQRFEEEKTRWLEARKACMILDRHRQRKKLAYEAEQDRKDQRQMDEMAMLNYRRRR